MNFRTNPHLCAARTGVAILLVLRVAGSASGQDDPGSFTGTEAERIIALTPKTEPDLLALQGRLQKAIEKARRATVCLQGKGKKAGSGSGVIVSKDGHILTAGHVTSEPGRTVTVVMEDGSKHAAESLGVSNFSDVGLARMEEKESWPVAEMAEGETSAGRVGDWCFALGHPGGYSKERGLVVRLGRIIKKRESVLQTDCKLLGGDSGGPLFDMDGRVIGIHSRISGDSDENFHVPIEAFERNWERLESGAHMTYKTPKRRSYLGVGSVQHPAGIVVKKVGNDSPAEKAGICVNDVITQLDGQPILSKEDFSVQVSGFAPGREITLGIIRDGSPLTLTARLAPRPKPKSKPKSPLKGK